MTKGEYRVGVSFNPSNNPLVDEIKQKSADLIDAIGYISVPEGLDPDTVATVMEIQRLKALAQTCVEEAAMWAVKAATKPKWSN